MMLIVACSTGDCHKLARSIRVVDNLIDLTGLSEGMAVEYRFRLSRKSGGLHIEHSERCVSDDQALAVGRRVLPPSNMDYRLEIWRGDECIYNGVPSSWPFQHVKTARSTGHASLPDDGGAPDAA